jgi:hypothetical protein
MQVRKRRLHKHDNNEAHAKPIRKASVPEINNMQTNTHAMARIGLCHARSGQQQRDPLGKLTATCCATASNTVA